MAADGAVRKNSNATLSAGKQLMETGIAESRPHDGGMSDEP
jgi:hypothetical protein